MTKFLISFFLILLSQTVLAASIDTTPKGIVSIESQFKDSNHGHFKITLKKAVIEGDYIGGFFPRIIAKAHFRDDLGVSAQDIESTQKVLDWAVEQKAPFWTENLLNKLLGQSNANIVLSNLRSLHSVAVLGDV